MFWNPRGERAGIILSLKKWLATVSRVFSALKALKRQPCRPLKEILYFVMQDKLFRGIPLNKFKVNLNGNLSCRKALGSTIMVVIAVKSLKLILKWWKFKIRSKNLKKYVTAKKPDVDHGGWRCASYPVPFAFCTGDHWDHCSFMPMQERMCISDMKEV